MSSEPHQAVARFSRLNQTLGRTLLSLWPADNKAWGVALASELSAIESPWRQFIWLLGGVFVLAREFFRSFLNGLSRPIGVGSIGSAGLAPDGHNPRTPRFLLALLALVFLWIFWQPQTRAVFRSVSQSYSEQGWDYSDWPEVRRIQALADKSQDPQLLAFASLFYSDRNKRLALADSAIQHDPSLTWIDYFHSWQSSSSLPSDQHALPPARLNRLIASDSGNSVLHLLRAETIAIPYALKDQQADPNANHIANWGALAHRDPSWLAAMNAAFSAPRYDSYDNQMFRLSQDVMRRYSINDPRIFASLLGRRTLYQIFSIRAYSKVLLSSAADAQRSGNSALAIRNCSLILDFAQHLRAANFFQLEKWTANDLEAQTYPLLQSLYENSGRHNEALAIAGRLQENTNERSQLSSGGRRFSNYGSIPWSHAEWAAILMQSSVLAIWILLPLSLLSIVLFLLLQRRLRGRARSIASLFADLCPALLVASCLVLYLTYSPYDRACREILQSSLSPARYEQIAGAAYAPFALPPVVHSAMDSLSGPHGRFLVWSALTAVLSVLLALICFRRLRAARIKRSGS